MNKRKDAKAYKSQGFALGTCKRAKIKLTRALKLKPNDIEIYNKLGHISREQGEYDQAAAKHKIAASINPEDTSAFLGMSFALFEQNRHAEALPIYERLLIKDPESRDVHGNLGYLYFNLGRYSDAIAAYNKAIELDPDDPELVVALGLSFRGNKQYDQAIESYKKAIAIDPSQKVDSITNWSAILYYQHKYEEVIDKCREGLFIDAENTDLGTNWGLTLLQLGKYSESTEIFIEVVDSIVLKGQQEMSQFKKSIESVILKTEKQILDEIDESEIRHLEVTIEGFKQIIELINERQKNYIQAS